MLDKILWIFNPKVYLILAIILIILAILIVYYGVYIDETKKEEE
jgi:hypothetical protein